MEGLDLVSGHDPNELFCPRLLDEEGWAEVRKQLQEFAHNTQVKVWNSPLEPKLIPHPHGRNVLPQLLPWG